MSIKAAIVDGPIAPELFQRLESMGFEIVDMNDREAIQGLRRRIAIEEAIRKMHDATGMHIVELRQSMSQIEAEFRLESTAEHVTIPMLLKAMEIEPMPDIRIDKTKDRFSPFDKFAGRGKGPARSQKFSNHFKRK